MSTLLLLISVITFAGLVVWALSRESLRSAQMVTDVSVPVPQVLPPYVVLPGSLPLAPPYIRHLFEMLPAALELYNKNPDVPVYRHARAFDTYVYQLFATVHADGTRQVRVVALPPERQTDPEWHSAPIHVADGGAGYFDAVVNLDLNLVSDIFVHGEA